MVEKTKILRETEIELLRASGAFAKGVAPIALIDGDKLIDLPIEHGIGVKKKIELLTADAEAFADVELEA